MKKFSIIPYNRKLEESWHDDISLLRPLEIMAKERKCRKKTRCSYCNVVINPGEMALKTVQASQYKGYLYSAYCIDCYSKIEVTRDGISELGSNRKENDSHLNKGKEKENKE